ncbi:MAG: nucleoside deaminase [Actinomycetaceae bacterium]|nr:nucleoside deaminase [Actinomycetaceae bacterium]
MPTGSVVFMTDWAQWRTWLRFCRSLAAQAADAGEVPVGAAVVSAEGDLVAFAHNSQYSPPDITGHAEILALRRAGAVLGHPTLEGHTLVVSLEPCTMCAGAAVLARVDRIVFGAWDVKAGACGSLRDVPRDSRMNHRPQVIGGIDEDAAAAQLQSFFRARR